MLASGVTVRPRDPDFVVARKKNNKEEKKFPRFLFRPLFVRGPIKSRLNEAHARSYALINSLPRPLPRS